MNVYNPYSLVNRTILITGASSGIGQTTAIECSRLGASVIITGRNEVRLRKTYSMLCGEGHLMVVADLSEEDGIISLVEKIPCINGFVSNAGSSKGVKPVLFYTKKDFDELMSVNTFATVSLVRAIVKKKKFTAPSSFVFTSSIEGVYKTSIGNGMYGMTKAALGSFTKSVALELSSKGIRCNAVTPGMVHTPLTQSEGALTESQLDEDRKRYPLGRYGLPEDIAWAIIYLLSDASSWVTGINLKIDGGITLI